MNKYLAGAIAGTVATVPMSLLMLYLHRRIPKEKRRPLPPKQITVKVAEELGAREAVDGKSERNLAAAVSHFAYGAATGTLYAAFAPRIDLSPLIKGTAYGLAVWTGSYLGLLPLTQIRETAATRPASENAMMIVAHVVWGATLGTVAARLKDGGDAE